MTMEVVEKSALGREILFSVEKSRVDEKRRVVVKELKENATVEGFRKGRVPESIIESKYADLIRENILKGIIPEEYQRAISEKGLSPAVEPEVSEVNLDDSGLRFKVYVELMPEVPLKKYKGISIKKKNPEPVTEKNIDEALEKWERRPEFAASIIDPSKRKAWREKIKAQLEDYSRMQAVMDEDRQLWDEIFKNTDFPVPGRMVREQALRYTEDYFSHMDLKEKTQEEREKLARDIFEKVKPEAEITVRKYFVLNKVAETENIEVKEEDIKQKITELSRTVGDSFEKMKEQLEKAGRMDDLKDDIRIQKAFRVLKENAQFIKRVILPGEDRKLETLK